MEHYHDYRIMKYFSDFDTSDNSCDFVIPMLAVQPTKLCIVFTNVGQQLLTYTHSHIDTFRELENYSKLSWSLGHRGFVSQGN